MPSRSPSAPSKRRFCLFLVKPTHYCDDGYPIRWFRSAIPSNSLACICGIAEDCAERNVLGKDVEIEIHTIDEANTRVRPQRIAALVKAADAGMVMGLIGPSWMRPTFAGSDSLGRGWSNRPRWAEIPYYGMRSRRSS